MTGTPDDRREDVYVTRDSAPAIPVELDLIAAARTYLVCWWRRFGGCGTHRPAASGAPHRSRISPALVGVKPQASKWNGIRWSSKSTCNHSQPASRAPADAAATKAVATPCLRCAMVTIFQDEGVPRPVPGNVHPGRVVGRNRTHTSAGRGPATGNRGPTHPPRHEGSDACLRVATWLTGAWSPTGADPVIGCR